MPNLTARENIDLVTEIADGPLDASGTLELVGLAKRQDQVSSRSAR
ncbi:hypothetical protein [Henriciella sp.]|nr:hypothetical protein [Henriciella sp.]